jgi:hypothetical protein
MRTRVVNKIYGFGTSYGLDVHPIGSSATHDPHVLARNLDAHRCPLRCERQVLSYLLEP